MPVGRGRPVGSKSKVTQHAREAIARLADANIDKCQEWLDEIAREDGAKAAFDCLMKLIEYHVPKPQRIELTGDGGGPVELEHRDLTAQALKFIPQEALEKILNDKDN